jgi:hypothetical protein
MAASAFLAKLRADLLRALPMTADKRNERSPLHPAGACQIDHPTSA